jgi:hypothetical protein
MRAAAPFEPQDDMLPTTHQVNADLRILVRLSRLLGSNVFGLDNRMCDLS